MTTITICFQCSSASRKFLNAVAGKHARPRGRTFSALQRAENSSIVAVTEYARPRGRTFSALQRAENSSIPFVEIAAGS